MRTIRGRHLRDAQLNTFTEDGYVVIRRLIPEHEVDRIRDHFMDLHRIGQIPDLFEPVPPERADGDILKVYPRMIMPHRYSALARQYLLDGRVCRVLWDLFGEEPLAAQSMFYFKPPGARGQALHQDNFYLRAEPGTCIAAWMAVDRADEKNGGLQVVPGSHLLDLVCPEEADPSVSFTSEYVAPPAGLAPVDVSLDPGDVLFFNGSVVHGSPPNSTTDRFRRSFICHYIGRSSKKLSLWYRQPLTMSGEAVAIEHNAWGGPCGTEDQPAIH